MEGGELLVILLPCATNQAIHTLCVAMFCPTVVESLAEAITARSSEAGSTRPKHRGPMHTSLIPMHNDD